MSYTELFEQLGSDVTATFGFGPPRETTQANPRSVQYGITFGTSDGDVLTQTPLPTAYLNFNKYRPDLPPWRKITEFVLANDTLSVSFIGVNNCTTTTTGDLKTVTLVAADARIGVEETAIISEAL